MAGQNGRDRRIQFRNAGRDALGHPPFQFRPHFVDIQPPGLLPGQHTAPARPGDSYNLERPGRRGDAIGLETAADLDARHGQGRENFHGVGPAAGVGQVVIAHQQKHRKAGRYQAADAAGKLPLMGLGRVAALIHISGQQNQIHFLGQGKLRYFVQGTEKIPQSGGKAGSRVEAAIVLHADMQVGKMQDTHRETSCGRRTAAGCQAGIITDRAGG